MHILVLFFLSFNVYATEVEYNVVTERYLNLKATKVEMGSFTVIPQASHIIDIIDSHGITQTLVCLKGASHLSFKNVANLHVTDFKIKYEKTCKFVATFLEKTFEFISESYPLKIRLDILKNEVSLIKLPDLDPYMQRFPEKWLEEKGIKNFYPENVEGPELTANYKQVSY